MAVRPKRSELHASRLLVLCRAIQFSDGHPEHRDGDSDEGEVIPHGHAEDAREHDLEDNGGH
jgi:hypothetical protein